MDKKEIKIEKLVNGFINDRYAYNGYKESMVKNLFSKDKKSGFLYNYTKGELVKDEVNFAIKQSVISYANNKGNAIEVYKRFIKYIEKKTGIIIKMEKEPPVPPDVSMERLMYIAKYLQCKDNKISRLPELLWVSKTTIEKDIAKLRGYDDDPLQVLGKKYVIEETERTNGRMEFSSTLHPFFLASNLTEVLITLKGLKSMSENPLFKGYADSMARSMWKQLSSYAKERIIFVLKSYLKESTDWHEKLESESKEGFLTERRCSSNDGPGVVLDCIKNQKKCVIEYLDNTNEKILFEDCSIKHFSNSQVLIISNKGEKQLKLDRILYSGYSIEEII